MSEPCYRATVAGSKLVRCAAPVVDQIDGRPYCAPHLQDQQRFLARTASWTAARDVGAQACANLTERFGVPITQDARDIGKASVAIEHPAVIADLCVVAREPVFSIDCGTCKRVVFAVQGATLGGTRVVINGRAIAAMCAGCGNIITLTVAPDGEFRVGGSADDS